MRDITIREVDYTYCKDHLPELVTVSTAAFMGNHTITQAAYAKTKNEYQNTFIELLNQSTEDMIHQCHKNGGLFFVAEANHRIVGISMGSPYGKSTLSEAFIENVFNSHCCFKEVMQDWWKLMGKYEGTPPGKIFHQGPMAIAPEYARGGIGAQLCSLAAQKIFEAGYQGIAVETSSNSADRLAEKMKQQFQVIDLDSNQAGLTFRLHLRADPLSNEIHRWFLERQKI